MKQVKDGPYIVPSTQNWLDAYRPEVRGTQTTNACTCGGYASRAGGWLDSLSPGVAESAPLVV